MKLIFLTLLLTYLALVLGSAYPSKSYGAPSTQGNEQSSYGAPSTQGNMQSAYPSQSYGAPSTQGNEQSAYGAPSTQGNMQSAYPSQSYGAPSTQGNQQSAYGAPSTQGNQQSAYGAPSTQGNQQSAYPSQAYPSTQGNEQTAYPSQAYSSEGNMQSAYPSQAYTSANQQSAYPSQAYSSEGNMQSAYPSQAYTSSEGNMQSAYPSQAYTSANQQSAYPSQAYPSTQGNEQSAYPSQAYTSANQQSAYPSQAYPSTQGNQQSGYGAPSSQGEVVSDRCQANLFSGTGVPMASNDCNDKGYCIPGSVDTGFRGCSCFSGWDGEDCKRERDTYQCVADAVRPDVSSFDTTIGGYLDKDGKIILTLRAPIESTIDDDKDNYATYTKLRFKNEDRCDYPEGVDTDWMKVFDNKACYETYNGTTSVSDLIKCTGEYVNCYDAKGVKIDCQPEACANKPCKRCYDANLLATRGYVRTTENRDLTATATAENCHYFQICLPWILNVESEIQVTPIQNFEFVIIRVAFSCFSSYATHNCNDNPLENWIVEIESTVHYPWFVKEKSTDSAKLSDGTHTYDMVELLQVSGCNDPTKDCVQRFRFEIPGCTALEDQRLFNIQGLEYDCFGDCADAKDELSNAGLLDVQGEMTLQATQDNCGLDFMIDGTDTVTLKMNPYLKDYETPNAVFIEGDQTIGYAYFKIIADSSIDIKQFNLVKLTSQKEGEAEITLGENAAVHGYIREDCPAAATEGGKESICIKALVTSLYNSLDPESDLVDVHVHAEVEVLFTDGSKRQVGLGNSYDLQSTVHVSPKNADAKSSATALAVASSLILAAF